MPKITDDQRARVVSLIREGKGRNEVSRATGVGQGTVSRIAQAEGLSIVPAGVDRTRLKTLTDAAQAFHHHRRLQLYAVAAEKAEAMLHDSDLTPKELQHVVTALAISHDKTRLESGEATSRHENTGAVVIYVPASPRLARPAPQVMDVAHAPLSDPSGHV